MMMDDQISKDGMHPGWVRFDTLDCNTEIHDDGDATQTRCPSVHVPPSKDTPCPIESIIALFY